MTISNLCQLFILVLGLTSQVVVAQSSALHQSLSWNRYFLRLQLDQKWTLHWELDNRVFLQPEYGQHQFITHLHAHRHWHNAWEGWLGGTYTVVSSQNPELAHSTVIPEYRPWQALSKRQDFQAGSLMHRLRWEQRFIRRSSGTALLTGTRFAFRIRYAATMQIPLSTRFTLKVGDEIMVQWGEGIRQAFDQNRAWAGLDFTGGKDRRWNIEMLYLWLWQQSATGSTFYDRDIIRLTLGQQISLQKKK